MPKRKLLEEVKEVLRIKNYCYGTEKYYILWMKPFFASFLRDFYNTCANLLLRRDFIFSLAEGPLSLESRRSTCPI